jgi:hypothetical protein
LTWIEMPWYGATLRDQVKVEAEVKESVTSVDESRTIVFESYFIFILDLSLNLSLRKGRDLCPHG